MDVDEEIKELSIPHLPDAEKYAAEMFKDELDGLFYPTLYVLPVTQEGEIIREYLWNYHFDKDDKCIWQSIGRYGCSEYNFEYKGELFLAILVNND
jgi:hypothetical protein